MKIFVAHASASDFVNELYKPLKECALAREHELFFPHDFGFDKVTQEIIQNQDYLIAEVSLPSTGQGIEIGWATAAGIPILCFYKQGTEPSGALPFVCREFIEYTDKKDMADKLCRYFKNLSR